MTVVLTIVRKQLYEFLVDMFSAGKRFNFAINRITRRYSTQNCCGYGRPNFRFNLTIKVIGGGHAKVVLFALLKTLQIKNAAAKTKIKDIKLVIF